MYHFNRVGRKDEIIQRACKQYDRRTNVAPPTKLIQSTILALFGSGILTLQLSVGEIPIEKYKLTVDEETSFPKLFQSTMKKMYLV